jgi:hypothetical protein
MAAFRSLYAKWKTIPGVRQFAICLPLQNRLQGFCAHEDC